MAFNVTLYSFTKEVNSTARPSGSGATYPCQVITPCDIINPQLRLQLGTGYNPSSYNYCYVPAWGRYYWINDWIMDGPIWTAACNVDPLASWKTEIGATSAYVLRAAAAYDGNVIDSLYPGLAQVSQENSTGTSPWTTDPAAGTFVLGIVGSGATQYLQFSKAALDAFLQYLLSNGYAVAAIGALSLGTNPELKAVLDPLQYIASIVWLPFSTAGIGTAVTSVRVGYVDVPVAARDIGTGVVSLDQDWTLRRHPYAASRGAYLNAAMAGYTLRYPPFGVVSIDPVLCANSATLGTTVLVDLKTGHASLSIFNDAGRMISRISGQVGLSYQVGQVIAPGYGLTGMLADAVNIGGAAITGNYLGMAQGMMANIGNVAKSRIPSSNTVGGVGGIDQLRGTPALQYEWVLPIADDPVHRGRPLCQVRRLDTLAGYQLCTDTDLRLPCTRTEMDAIKGYLESGYYFE